MNELTSSPFGSTLVSTIGTAYYEAAVAELSTLDSISVGFTQAGRSINTSNESTAVYWMLLSFMFCFHHHHHHHYCYHHRHHLVNISATTLTLLFFYANTYFYSFFLHQYVAFIHFSHINTCLFRYVHCLCWCTCCYRC